MINLAWLRNWLPYGKWVVGDNERVVIFDRKYHPLIETKDGVSKPADPGEWVGNVASQTWFRRGNTTRSMWMGGRSETLKWIDEQKWLTDAEMAVLNDIALTAPRGKKAGIRE